MGAFDAFDPVDEQNLIADARGNIQNQKRLEETANQDVASRVGTIYRDHPYVPASVILALAKGGASPQTVQAAATIAGQRLPQQESKPKKKSWLERNVTGKFKTATRWGFAALDLVPDLAQNVASQAFSDNDPAGWDGWFKSTKFGTMLDNSDVSGEGFFMGGKAAEKQAERAREFRGTINGSAWTIGRGAAEVFFTPGSKPYSILSGFVDAAVLLGTDPTNYYGATVGKQLAEASRIPGLSGEALEGARVIARGEAGLDAAEAIGAFNDSRFYQWVTRNNGAKRLVQNVVNVGVDDALDIDAKTFKVLEMFDYRIDPETAARFAEAKSTDEVRGLLGEAAARLSNSPDDILLPSQIKDLGGAGLFYSVKQRTPLYRNIRNSRWFSQMPKGSVAINGTGLERAESIKTYANYLRGIGIDDVDNHPVMKMAVQAFREQDKTKAKELLDNAFDGVVKEALIKADPRIAIPFFSPFVDNFKNELKQLGEINFGNIDKAARAAMKNADTTKGKDFIADFITKLKEQITDGGPITQKQLNDAIKNATDNIDPSLAPNFLDDFVANARAELAEARAYSIGELSNLDDTGLFKALQDFVPQEVLDQFTPDQWDNIRNAGPGAIAELIDTVQFLPDFRQIRAFTGNKWFRRALYSGETGQMRSAAQFASFIQTDIWKPLQLATGGYIMRNMFDAQVRMATAGLKGAFSHPFEYIMLVLNKKSGFSITGQGFDAKLFANQFESPQGLKAFQQSLQFGSYKYVEDSQAALEAGVRNGNFPLVDRRVDPKAHTIGYVDNLGIINNSPELNLVARYGNLEPDERVQRVLEYLNRPENAQDKKNLVAYIKGGLVGGDPETGSRFIIPIAKDAPEDEIIERWVRTESQSRINTIVRGDEDLRVVAAFDRVPLYEQTADGATVAAERVRLPLDDLRGNYVSYDEQLVGSIVRGSAFGAEDTVEGVVIAIVREGGQEQALIQPVFAGPALTDDFLGSKPLRNLIDMKGNEPRKLATIVKRAERGSKTNPTDNWKKTQNLWNKGTNFFFNRLYGTASAKLEKSPVFRQYYYETVSKNVDLLSKDEAQKLLGDINRRAGELGIKPSDYVGGRKTWKQLQDNIAKADGDGAITELDQFAQALALDNTKKLLYDASEKNNLEDIMRIIVPFGGAWREVLSTYLKFAIEDPTRIRKAQLIFTGATKFDPDANGEGFFYKDPTTGEYSFNFPLSSSISKLLTGIEAPMQAPVKRLSVGLGVIPSLGPVGQIAASKIIPDTPSFDFVTELLLPYGRTSGINLQPNWSKKLIDAIRANPNDFNSMYANTYVETVRALVASGQYDMSDINEKERVLSDAKRKAQILSGLRAFGQFIGPTSPQAEFKVPTEGGDQYAMALAKELYKFQAENYDTAVERFLDTFGEDAFIYLSSKTRSVYGGLEATEQFGDWERGNGGLFGKYPDVAGFMAPGGDDFSFEVWSRQMRSGKRERLTAREVVDQAQYRVASAKYRALRNKLPANPTQEQKDWLKKWRVKLNQEYPGFPVVPEFNPGEYPAKIVQLKNMVMEPSLQNNEVAQATAQYLDFRDKAIQRYVQAGGREGGFGQAVAAEPLRDWLFEVGQALSLEVPEFGRIWDRLLSSEVEQ